MILRDVLAVAPDYSQAVNIPHYGWMAVLFAALSYLIYVCALLCSHLAAFRVATNLRLTVTGHLAKLPLGFTESFGSGRLRKIIQESTGAAETYLAHQLPDQYSAIPMLFYTAAINGVFAFLIAGGLLFTKNGVTSEFLLNLRFYIIITPVISLTLTKIMYMSENKMMVADALSRIDSVLDAEPVSVSGRPEHPKDSSVTLKDVAFSYDGKSDVIKGISMDIRPGQTVALVGPSGGGKSTLAVLICRFFDVCSGSIAVGGADVQDIPKEELMNTVSFVFQNSRLLKGSILDNVKLGKPDATEEEVLAAQSAVC